MMKDLPVGQQNFDNLIQDNGVYVDKTQFIHQLITGAKRSYFLSRPRRFGKSLLLSTIKAVFEAKKELFKGLFIYDKIDWTAHPVILLDMSSNILHPDRIEERIIEQLNRIAANYHISLQYRNADSIFSELVWALFQKTGKQVVVLIDEYDKPILDSIDHLDRADGIRAYLQAFYSVLKSASEALRFVMLTGVSKISQTSVFSGLNNLSDISLNEDYAAICGYTQQELEREFDEHIDILASRHKTQKSEFYQEIKKWYDGYSWDGGTFMYNPFSVLKLLEEKDFSDYWFSTGTPTFLIKLLKDINDFSPVLQDSIIVSRNFDSKQSLENLELVPLFFQTGYLTIKKRFLKTREYELQVPNEEVRAALIDSLIHNFVDLQEKELRLVGKKLYDAFKEGNIPIALEYLKTIYSNASYHDGIYNEGYYHNLLEIIAKFSGIDIVIESRTDLGRADSIFKFADKTYVIEIKYSQDKDGLKNAAEAAMQQIKRNGYMTPWLHQGKHVYLLALAFTKGDIAYLEEIIPS